MEVPSLRRQALPCGSLRYLTYTKTNYSSSLSTMSRNIYSLRYMIYLMLLRLGIPQETPGSNKFSDGVDGGGSE
jgi:hypothetical protein